MYTVELPMLLDPVKVPENNIGGNSGEGGVGIKSHSMMCGDACTKKIRNRTFSHKPSSIFERKNRKKRF